MKNRESNYELLRIIAMFLIVLYHVIFHGNVIKYTTGMLQEIFEFIKLFTMIHVNIFILIMGYFQSKSKFNIRKIISILFQVWFYNILVNGLLKYFNVVEYTKIEFINAISPFNLNSYWFVYCYLIMYMLTPFVNKVIDTIDRVTFKKIVILLICIFGVIPYATFGLAWGYNIYSIEQFILMYFIGAYIRKYELDKIMFSSVNKTQKRALCIGIFTAGLLINFVLCLAQKRLTEIDSNTFRFIAQNIRNLISSYSNPILIVQSIAMFVLFGTFSFKSKWVNYISSLILGVYLIHDGWYARYSIYRLFKIDTGIMLYGKIQVIRVIVLAIIIFVVGLIVEMIRQGIIKVIYKIKGIKNLDNKFVNYIENLIELKS